MDTTECPGRKDDQNQNDRFGGLSDVFDHGLSSIAELVARAGDGKICLFVIRQETSDILCFL